MDHQPLNLKLSEEEHRESDDEVQTLERLYDDKAYFKTLSRNQRYSLTRRIQEEYNRNQSRSKRRPIPTEWREETMTESSSSSSPVALRTYRNRSASEAELDAKHNLSIDWAKKDSSLLPRVTLTPPAVGSTSFDDLSEEELSWLKNMKLSKIEAR